MIETITDVTKLFDHWEMRYLGFRNSFESLPVPCIRQVFK